MTIRNSLTNWLLNSLGMVCIMYHRNEEGPGIGLFTKIIDPSNQLTDKLEHKILSNLKINDLINFATLNKIWNRKMTEEIKRRKNCVTVYTWLSSEIPIESYRDNGSGTRGRMGHSALKTYGNSDGEKGIYVSFYAGDCHSAKRIPSCRKSTSHFHTWNQEMSKEMSLIAKKVDLYGLDVDAIHEAFHELHDDKMNSKKSWSLRYNCSDMVLFLLEKGQLFHKAHYMPFGWKTISAIGIFNGIFGFRMYLAWALAFMGGLFNIPPGKRIIMDLGPKYYETDYSLGYPRHYSTWPLSNYCGGIMSMSMMYICSLASYSKSSLSFSYYHKTCLISTIKAGLIGFIVPGFEAILVRNFSFIKENMYYIDNLANIFDIIINNDSIVSLVQRGKNRINLLENSNIYKDLLTYFLIYFFPLVGMLIYLTPKYFFDTTTTPNHVLKIVHPLENQLKETVAGEKQNSLVTKNEEILMESTNLASTIYKNRYKFGIGGLLAAGGFFAFKYISNLQNSPLETLGNNI